MEKGTNAGQISDKRRFRRVNIPLPITGRLLSLQEEICSFKGEINDMSYGGLCIKVNREDGFRAARDIEFRTRLYEGDFLLKAKGTVKWINVFNHSDPFINIGVKISHMRHYRRWCERVEDQIYLPGS